jgi:hypothetical protein
MRQLSRYLLHYIVYPNLFMVVCALLMTQQTIDLFRLRLSHVALIPFIASATLCSYSLHWYLTPVHPSPSPRIAWNAHNNRLLFLLFAGGLLGCMLFLVPLLEHALPIAIAMGAAFLYTAPKLRFQPLAWLSRIQVAKTLFLAFTWMYVTTLLPMLVDEEPIHAPQILFCASRLFFIYSICVLFDHRDRDEDRRQRIRSLPTIMSDTQVRWLFLSTLIGYLLLTLALSVYFPTSVIVMLAVPGVFTALLFRRAMEQPSDLLFYFVLDGLMALSSVLTLFLSI